MPSRNCARHSEGMMKWFNSSQDAAVILNDSWYLNTIGLICVPAAAEAEGQHTTVLVRALFPNAAVPFTQEEEGAHLTIAGFTSKSLSTAGIQALFALASTFGVTHVDLSSALRDGAQGATVITEALPKW